jgi:hypothetical protein
MKAQKPLVTNITRSQQICRTPYSLGTLRVHGPYKKSFQTNADVYNGML